MYLQKGNLYNQIDFYKSLNAFARAGVWQSTNILVDEVKQKDSLHKIDLIVQLMPVKQYGYEASLEASYSASSNTNSVTAANAGNLLGLSGNISFINRNLRKEGIKMTNSLLAGVEFNFVQTVEIGGVGNGNKQAIAASKQGKSVMFFNQLAINQIARNALWIKGCDVYHRRAKFLRRSRGDAFGIHTRGCHQL